MTIMPENHCFFAAGTPVLTDSGYMEIERLRKGDSIITQSCDSVKIKETKLSEPQEVLELNAQGILPIQATPNCTFVVRTKHGETFSNTYTKPLHAITEGDYIGVPIITTEENPHNIPKEECYSLGNYLGRKYNLFNASEISADVQSDSSGHFEDIGMDILCLPDECVRAFVEGYFECGNHIRPKTCCKTNSFEFAVNMCLAIQKAFKVGCYICTSKLFSSGKYIVTFNPEPVGRSWVVIDNAIWYPVYDVKPVNHGNYFYCIETEKECAYIVQNCIIYGMEG